MKNRLTSLLALGAAAMLAAATSTHAATIVWGLPTNIAGDTDVSLTGSLVRAFNVGSSAVPPSATTVNGVLFEPITQGSTVGNFTLNPTAAGFSGADGSLSAAYRTLLEDAAFSQTGPNITLTINGLSVGGGYLFEWWSNTNGAGPTLNGTLTSAGGAPLDANTTDTAGTGRGQYQIGTFVADNATQIITFANVGTSAFGGILNGFQLRQAADGAASVPEAGTALIILAIPGVLALHALHRRRRA